MFQYISCLRKCHPTCQFCCPPAGHVSPCLSLSTVVWERPDLKKREKHLAWASSPTPYFFDGQICGSSLLLSSNVQHVKSHKAQTTEVETSLSNGISFSSCPNWSWWELEHLFLAFVSWSLGLVSSFSLLYGFTTLNLVPALRSLSVLLETKQWLWSWTLELYKEENPFTLYFAFSTMISQTHSFVCSPSANSWPTWFYSYLRQLK